MPGETLKIALENKSRANPLSIKKLTRKKLEPDGDVLNYIREEFHLSLNEDQKLFYYSKVL